MMTLEYNKQETELQVAPGDQEWLVCGYIN